MNKGFFTGRVARAPVLRGGAKTPVCFFTLIRNEFAGRDEGGEARERQVAIPFTIFGVRAEALAKHAFEGDQLIVEYHLQNNNQGEGDDKEYGYSFVVEDFDFGAPGKAKREQLAKAHD